MTPCGVVRADFAVTIVRNRLQELATLAAVARPYTLSRIRTWLPRVGA